MEIRFNGWYRTSISGKPVVTKGSHDRPSFLLRAGQNIYVQKVDEQNKTCYITEPTSGWVSMAGIGLIDSKQDVDHFSPDISLKIQDCLSNYLCEKLNWIQGEEIFDLILTFLVDPKKKNGDPQPRSKQMQMDDLLEDFSAIQNVNVKLAGKANLVRSQQAENLFLREEIRRIKGTIDEDKRQYELTRRLAEDRGVKIEDLGYEIEDLQKQAENYERQIGELSEQKIKTVIALELEIQRLRQHLAQLASAL